MVRLLLSALVLTLALASASPAGAQSPAGSSPSSPTIDPATSLESRVGETDTSVLKMFADAGMPTPSRHVLTDGERAALMRGFEALPAAHQRVVRERLRRISFLDGMPNTALTSRIDGANGVALYDLTIRASVLRETVSEFLTQKERTCFDLTGSARTVVVDAGSLDAIVYVLLHEATHMVDNALGLTPPPDAAAKGPYPFTDGIWTDRLTIAPPYASPSLEGLAYRRGGRAMPIADAEAIYGALRRTPFASLYASSNWHDDVAELLAWHHLTSRMGQPYRIVVRDGTRDTLVYEPMSSALVRDRVKLLDRFYDAG